MRAHEFLRPSLPALDRYPPETMRYFRSEGVEPPVPPRGRARERDPTPGARRLTLARFRLPW